MKAHQNVHGSPMGTPSTAAASKLAATAAQQTEAAVERGLVDDRFVVRDGNAGLRAVNAARACRRATSDALSSCTSVYVGSTSVSCAYDGRRSSAVKHESRRTSGAGPERTQLGGVAAGADDAQRHLRNRLVC